MSEAAQRLAAARARLDARAAAKADRDAERALEREADALELEDRVAAAVDELETTRGLALGRTMKRVDLFHDDGSLAVSALVSAPPSSVWRRFKTAMGSGPGGGPPVGAKRDEALEALYKPCLVWPSFDDVSKLSDKFPRLPDALADGCAVLAGAQREETQKKS